MDVEGQLGPLSEAEEFPLQLDGAYPGGPKASFSVGATMGRVVHGVVNLCRWIMRTLASLLTGLARGLVHANVLKYAAAGLAVWFLWSAVNSGALDLGSLPVLRGPSRPYHPPDIPAADLAALSARLQSLEKAVAGLSLDAERSRVFMEGDAKYRADIGGRVGTLETRIQRESSRAQDAENKYRSAAAESLNVVKKEVSHLSIQLQSLRDTEAKRPAIGSDEEARAKLKAL